MWRPKGRCAICGAKLSKPESVASLYTCFVTCIPVVKSDHLASAHPEYLREAKLVSRLVVYPAIALSLATLPLLALGATTLAFATSIGAGSLFFLGSYLRVSLVGKHKATYEGGLKNIRKSDASKST